MLTGWHGLKRQLALNDHAAGAACFQELIAADAGGRAMPAINKAAAMHLFFHCGEGGAIPMIHLTFLCHAEVVGFAPPVKNDFIHLYKIRMNIISLEYKKVRLSNSWRTFFLKDFMKTIGSILLIFCVSFLIAQTDTSYQKEMLKSDYYLKVHGFIPHTKLSPTTFFTSPFGAILDSIKNSDDFHWICVTIDSQSGNWAKLKSVQLSPGLDSLKQFDNSWILINELWLNLSNDSSTIYNEPNISSTKMKVPFQTVNILEVKNNWAKVQFEYNGKKIVGWVSKEDQCGYPWTTCSY